MTARERLVGSWRLVSFAYELSNGATVDAYGHKPVGLLMYDDLGYVAAQIMNPDRSRFATGDRRLGTLEELHSAMEGYIAYFGTYEVFEDDGYVIHRELGDVFPNAVGTRQKRFFAFEGDRLVLRVPPVVLGGERMTATIIWERAGRVV